MMNPILIKLVGPDDQPFTIAEVVDEGDHFGGTIPITPMPAHIQSVFEEFEEIVNGQMLSFLDEIEAKIRDLRIKAVFDDGQVMDIQHLQIYPSTGDISFKPVAVLAPTTRIH